LVLGFGDELFNVIRGFILVFLVVLPAVMRVVINDAQSIPMAKPRCSVKGTLKVHVE
jgi:hypothetical protein